jgi:hypothetical protein
MGGNYRLAFESFSDMLTARSAHLPDPLGLRNSSASGAAALRLRPLRASLLTSFANSAKRASLLIFATGSPKPARGFGSLFSSVFLLVAPRTNLRLPESRGHKSKPREGLAHLAVSIDSKVAIIWRRALNP